MIIIILLLTLGSVDCSSYGNAISLVNASQYHFIPNGSFLQFSLSSAELGYDTS